MLAAVILSGGESSRMGSPKALIPFRGSTFLGCLLETIQQANEQAKKNSDDGRVIGCTRVVLGAHTKEISEKIPLDSAEIVVNPQWQQGQLSSMQAAIRSIQETPTDGVMFFLVDHPMVSPELVAELVRKFYASGRAILVPKFRDKRGHPVIFASRLYGELLAAPADQGARAVVWAHADEVLEVPTNEEGVVLNLNDPEALRRALTGV
jgi:molybdenum cofactor cytidylyltransferase